MLTLCLPSQASSKIWHSGGENIDILHALEIVKGNQNQQGLQGGHIHRKFQNIMENVAK